MPNHNRLYWKVCGMKDAVNVKEVAALRPDFMGFIFFKKSPRYMVETLEPADLDSLDESTRRVGVFVDPSLEEVEQNARLYSLDLIQLHGDETAEFIAELKTAGFNIIKVVAGNRMPEPGYMKEIEPLIEYWLLDTRTDLHGGTGIKFDRKVLNDFDFEKPVLLSGGLDQEEVRKIRAEEHPAVVGVDVNSRMEDAPGLKNLNKLKELIACLN
ncbi:phosphoribosylanthranilate isomerase [Fulvivirga sedimenti]|uniref:N-(5'-phosphoribosyl)anthranilate isomerase n=1 Tax=Fulvivirga sedimenti TaxID=2879465 RepID=A0A9X1KW41_9BACT|nr:phosphoribosylanthranilate isomerase [Fulvivirga sedimenti]MCA6073579.1 phosphoribosylanthranilate isomerase [Fulvivirga sedimenti]